MISSIVGPLQFKSQPLIPTTTKLKGEFEKIKLNLEIFKDLKENEKLGKQINSKGEAEYYKVQEYPGLWLSRWWNDEGRLKTIEYLDTDFSEFMKFLDELLKNLEIDPFCKYAKMATHVRKFIDSILPGLYSLKKTYPDTKKMAAKVDSIILTLIDFKDKTEDYVKQKNKGIKLLISKSFN
tara:strand:- start:51 stop:593 length:543 start_codon:yes stop_codon:yes gene_type:complete